MSGRRRAESPPPAVTFFTFSAGPAPLLRSLFASAATPAPAAAPAAAPLPAGLHSASAAAAAAASAFFMLAFTIDTGTVSAFDDTSKLVFGGTPASAPGLAPASAPVYIVSAPRGAGLPPVPAGLTVLLAKVFHHCLKFVHLCFFFSEKSQTRAAC